MQKEIVIKPVGVIRTPYKEPKGMPIQGKFEKDVTGKAQLFPKFRPGLEDIGGFSHVILIYYFDRAHAADSVGKPFLEDEPHGIFAIRSPARPNHIGLSVVRLEKIENDGIVFSEVDILDNTPLLDIKPYISHFDSREDVRNGWLDKHFKSGKIPKRAKIG